MPGSKRRTSELLAPTPQRHRGNNEDTMAEGSGQAAGDAAGQGGGADSQENGGSGGFNGGSQSGAVPFVQEQSYLIRKNDYEYHENITRKMNMGHSAIIPLGQWFFPFLWTTALMDVFKRVKESGLFQNFRLQNVNYNIKNPVPITQGQAANGYPGPNVPTHKTWQRMGVINKIVTGCSTFAFGTKDVLKPGDEPGSNWNYMTYDITDRVVLAVDNPFQKLRKRNIKVVYKPQNTPDYFRGGERNNEFLDNFMWTKPLIKNEEVTSEKWHIRQGKGYGEKVKNYTINDGGVAQQRFRDVGMPPEVQKSLVRDRNIEHEVGYQTLRTLPVKTVDTMMPLVQYYIHVWFDSSDPALDERTWPVIKTDISNSPITGAVIENLTEKAYELYPWEIVRIFDKRQTDQPVQERLWFMDHPSSFNRFVTTEDAYGALSGQEGPSREYNYLCHEQIHGADGKLLNDSMHFTAEYAADLYFEGSHNTNWLAEDTIESNPLNNQGLVAIMPSRLMGSDADDTRLPTVLQGSMPL